MFHIATKVHQGAKLTQLDNDGLKDGITGYLVPPGNPETIAEKLKHLIDNPAKRKEMGKAGRKFVSEKYNQAMLNLRLVELYNE